MSNISVHSTKVVQDSTDITTSVQYLRVSFGLFGNTKKVKSDILNTHADKQMLNVNKKLLQSPELEAIRQHDANLRLWLEKKCVPFPGWPGVLLLPPAFTVNVWERLEENAESRQVLVKAFVKRYPVLRAEAQTLLQEEFNNSDYPPINAVIHRFRFDWTIRSFDTPESLKQISSAVYEKSKKDAEEQFTNALAEISEVLRVNFYKMIAHLRDKLSPDADGTKKRLHESTIDNLKEFINDFPFRNVSNDVELEAVVAKVKALISDTDAPAIRQSAEFRTKMYEAMGEISTTLGTMVEDEPIRKFRD